MYMYMYIYIYIHTYTCMYISVYVYIYIYIGVYIYIYTYVTMCHDEPAIYNKCNKAAILLMMNNKPGPPRKGYSEFIKHTHGNRTHEHE